MAGNAVRSNQCSEAISGFGCQSLDLSRPSRRMVRARTSASASNVVLELARVFPKIVQQTNDGGQTPRPELFRSQRSQPRYSIQMLRQRLPCIPIPAFNRMGKEHAISSTDWVVSQLVV